MSTLESFSRESFYLSKKDDSMNDQYYMNLALQLARSVKGQTYPNPPVGAIVVKNGVILGIGAHLKSGTAHAEVHALQMAGDLAEGATIYVTLEPCSHQGKTPPCAQLIINQKLARVVIAQQDLHDKVAGRGINMLKNAGIEVEVGLMQEEAAAVHDVFFHYIQTKRPYVTMKTGVSLDGKIATASGESQWITSEASRLDVHYYRHIHDAILVGVNTVLTDNPKLTTRLPDGGKNPVRVILDTHLRTPIDANVITDELAPTILFVGHSVPVEKIARYTNHQLVEVVQMKTETLIITDVLDELGKREIASLFVEGGATVNDSFLRSRFINEFILYIAPKLIGGRKAPTSIGGEGIHSLCESLALSITSVEKIGDDVKIVAKNKG